MVRLRWFSTLLLQSSVDDSEVEMTAFDTAEVIHRRLGDLADALELDDEAEHIDVRWGSAGSNGPN